MKILPECRPGVVFNINFPARRPKGVKVTRQEKESYADSYERRTDPRGRTYYWINGNPEGNYQPGAFTNGQWPTDAWAVSKGYVSITPLHRDLTNTKLLSGLQKKLRKK